MRTCTLLSRRRCPSQGCAPRFGAASTALAPLRTPRSISLHAHARNVVTGYPRLRLTAAIVAQ
eukprot:3335125-Alexandrium_andersonii.AAC.1